MVAMLLIYRYRSWLASMAQTRGAGKGSTDGPSTECRHVYRSSIHRRMETRKDEKANVRGHCDRKIVLRLLHRARHSAEEPCNPRRFLLPRWRLKQRRLLYGNIHWIVRKHPKYTHDEHYYQEHRNDRNRKDEFRPVVALPVVMIVVAAHLIASISRWPASRNHSFDRVSVAHDLSARVST
jgi:hypothetical protein